ncbi:hypothetical protein MKEN_00540900 [Mycena kentingensis (nom. inval.)]|nr:hypothetical protein MKEN_00540900 [Mycena kentingensis (nom. inval.)]
MAGYSAATSAEGEDLKAFKTRLHAQIKAELEPSVHAAKQQMLSKMKHAKEAQKPALLKEYNDAILAIDRAGTERFTNEVTKERIRRSAAGIGESLAGERAQSRMEGFVGDSGNDFGEWGGHRPASTTGHVRGKSSIGNQTSLLSGTRPASAAGGMYTSNSSRPSTAAGRPSYPFKEDSYQSNGLDDAKIRKFAEEQARLERAHTPGNAATDDSAAMMRKFAEEQARLHRAHSPEITRNSASDAQRKFMEEQTRLYRAHSPELPRGSVSESPKLYRTGISVSPADAARVRKVSTTSSSPVDARFAAFAVQQQQQQDQYRQFTPVHNSASQDALRNASSSRMGQHPPTLTIPTPTSTTRAKPIPTPTTSASASAAVNGRRNTSGGSASSGMFGRFPLNERDHDIKSTYADDDTSTLTKVEVLFFDLDGTVLDWQKTVADELRRSARGFWDGADTMEWEGFALKWREMYMLALRNLAQHGNSLEPSTVYRTTLDQMLSAKEAEEVATKWTPTIRAQLVEVWTKLQAWPDVQDALKGIKTLKTVATICNESLRTQTQINRRAGLAWDVCLSGPVLGSFKGVPDIYLQAARSMSLAPANCALVSAHVDELRVAASAGFRTIYVHRASERALDLSMAGAGVKVEAEVTRPTTPAAAPNGKGKGKKGKNNNNTNGNVNGATSTTASSSASASAANDASRPVRSKAEGGEVDLVVESLVHLALALGCDL